MNSDQSSSYDVVVVGGGPIGLAAGLELQNHNVSYLILEKGAVVNSIFHYPTNMNFFTYNTDLAIGGYPFAVQAKRPNRNEALAYYREITKATKVNIQQYEEVLAVTGSDGDFKVKTRLTDDPSHPERSYKARKVIVATGYYDNPNLLGIEGEDDPSLCSHYFTDPHPYFGRKVTVVGGGNSAAEASLELYRNGVDVTLVHRGSELRQAIKYWVMPDIKGRIRDKDINAFFETSVMSIRPKQIILDKKGEIIHYDTDYTFLLTGYHPDYDFLRSIGLELEDDGRVRLDTQSFESTMRGIFVVGSAGYGRNLNKIFIENGRCQAENAVQALVKTL